MANEEKENQETENENAAEKNGTAGTKETDGGSKDSKRTKGGSETSQGRDEETLQVTDLAAEKIKEISKAEGLEGCALRVKVVGGGCAGFEQQLFFEEKQTESGEKGPVSADEEVDPADFKISTKGVCILVDQMSMMYLRGTIIDYVSGLAGTGFKFNNPNVSSTCGCGASFSV